MYKNSEKNNVMTQKNHMEIQKSLNEIQQNTDAKLTNIITSELSDKEKIVKSSEVKKTVNDLTLDTDLLYKKCEDLYEQILNESEYDENDN